MRLTCQSYDQKQSRIREERETGDCHIVQRLLPNPRVLRLQNKDLDK